MKKFIKSTLSSIIILTVGCASLPVDNELYRRDLPEPEVKGVFHKVRRGETLWRIAKAYEVSINDIIETNNIPNAAQIEENQLILIPGADSVREIDLQASESENDFIWPVKGKVIRYFRQQTSGGQVNKGIDIRVDEGEAVKAARSGRVVFADYLSGYGYTVIIDHADGFHSVYSQNSKLLVSLGEAVAKEKPISHIGRNDNLAFLHFEIRKNSIEDNPLHYLP